MTVNALGEAECVGQIEIEGKACKRGHASWFLFFFVLVRKESLWHN
jgi:hypothetical protein